MYKNFSNVLTERLPDASRAGTLWELKAGRADSMSVDLEESSAMEVDNENERQPKRFPSPTNPNNKIIIITTTIQDKKPIF